MLLIDLSEVTIHHLVLKNISKDNLIGDEDTAIQQLSDSDCVGIFSDAILEALPMV